MAPARASGQQIMDTRDQPEPDAHPIFHGLCPLLIAAFGVAVAYFILSLARVRDTAEDLLIQGGCAMYMTLTLGLAIASWRRGPKDWRGSAAVAMAICVVSIGWVVVACVKVLLR